MPISPNQSSESGGQTVTITGVNLINAITVHFGENAATITANTPTSITVLNPSGTGVCDVTVVTNGGTSNGLAFYYIPFPIITTLSAASGPTAGGNTINIYGYNLSTATEVSFAANTATPTIVNDGLISVTVPAGTSAGDIQMNVTTVGGTTANFNYTYVDEPTLSSISPSSGPTNGGTSVTLSGTGFQTTNSITVGGNPCSYGVINSTTLAIITPPGTSGAADVVVTTNGGSATSVGGYTYISSPGI